MVGFNATIQLILADNCIALLAKCLFDMDLSSFIICVPKWYGIERLDYFHQFISLILKLSILIGIQIALSIIHLYGWKSSTLSYNLNFGDQCWWRIHCVDRTIRLIVQVTPNPEFWKERSFILITCVNDVWVCFFMSFNTLAGTNTCNFTISENVQDFITTLR